MHSFNVNEDTLHLLNYNTYFDYVKSFFSKQDKMYMPDYGKCDILVQVGYRSANKIYTEEEFLIKKKEIEQWFHPKKEYPTNFSKALKKPDLILEQLAYRERSNLNKIISTIIYIYCISKTTGNEISGYIDYEHSLRSASLKHPGARDWHAIFSGRKTIFPKRDDLSYVNMSRKLVLYTDTDNYLVVHSLKNGLSFRHRGDHKLIGVDVSNINGGGGNNTRTMYFTNDGFIVFYDHIIRKKI